MSTVSPQARHAGSVSQSSEAPVTKKTKGRIPRAFKNKKVVIAGLIVALGIGYLIFSALQSTTMYYLTVGEIKAKGSEVINEPLRAGGNVVDGTVNFDKNSKTLKFAMTDGQEEMDVIYTGIVPDTFKSDAEVIVEGKYDGSVFKADNLLAKCPSKYVPGT